MMRHWLTACLIGLLLVAGLSACSIPTLVPTPTASPPTEPPPTEPPSTDPGATDPGAGGGGVGGGGATTSSPDASAAAATQSDQSLGPIVASRSSSYKGNTIHLDLYRIVRAGNLAHVTVTVRSPDGASIVDLSDNRSKAGQMDSYAADGITLIDTADKKLYLVASDGEGNCLCTQLGSLGTLGDNPSIISASFAAPPTDVTAMDVQIPRFGAFLRVPVV